MISESAVISYILRLFIKWNFIIVNFPSRNKISVSAYLVAKWMCNIWLSNYMPMMQRMLHDKYYHIKHAVVSSEYDNCLKIYQNHLSKHGNTTNSDVLLYFQHTINSPFSISHLSLQIIRTLKWVSPPVIYPGGWRWTVFNNFGMYHKKLNFFRVKNLHFRLPKSFY